MGAGFILLLLVLVLAVVALAIAYILKCLKTDSMVMVENPCDRQLVNIVLNLPEKERIRLEGDIRRGSYNG